MSCTTVERSTTLTHAYRIVTWFYDPTIFEVEFRPLNPKTGKPWQASHRITHGADYTPKGWREPQCFSTIEAARAAVAWKQANLKR